MEKLLESFQAIHRALVVSAIALVVLGMSIQPITKLYAEAEGDLDKLQETLLEADDMTTKAYARLYGGSPLHRTVRKWMRAHGIKQRKVDIEVVLPRDLAVPNLKKDGQITVGEEVGWADNAYGGFRGFIGVPLIYCRAVPESIGQALTKATAGVKVKSVFRILVRVEIEHPNPILESDFTCSLSIEYEVLVGRLSGIERTALAVSAHPVLISGGIPGYDIPGLFKTSGFGDWEDNSVIVVPALRALWSEMSPRSVASARAYLTVKQEEENTKAKRSLSLFGGSLNAPLAVELSCLVMLFLLLALVVYARQVGSFAAGNEDALRFSPLFGVARSPLGLGMFLATILLLPVSAAFISLVIFLGPIARDNSEYVWYAGGAARWSLISSVVLTGVLLAAAALQVVTRIRRWEHHGPTLPVGGERSGDGRVEK